MDLEQNYLDMSNRVILDLNNIDDKISYENKAIILWNSLANSFNEVKIAIKYGVIVVWSGIRSRDLEIKKSMKHLLKEIDQKRDSQRIQ